MLTRWNEWFSKENLETDKRILAAPPSICASVAAEEFLSRGKQHILDLACGVGRDTFQLGSYGLSVVGVDAAFNGVRVAHKRKVAQGASFELTNADAKHLPFRDGAFEGVYCFGLLHEFTSETWEVAVDSVMREVKRLLCDQGILALTVLSGIPEEGLPKVRLFTQSMFEHAIRFFRPIEIKAYDDVGCTGRPDYHVWYGLLEKA